MSEKDVPTPLPLDDDESTRSINVAALFPEEVATSGSFPLEHSAAAAFGRLLDAIPLPALVVDESLFIAYANEACIRIGWDSQGLRGKLLAAAFDSISDGKGISGLAQQVLRERQPRMSDRPLEIGGKYLWCRLHMRSLKQGSIRSVLLLLEDLTAERKQFLMSKKQSQDLRRAHDTLEEVIQQRTAELVRANAALRQEIVERNRAEMRFRVSEERYKELVELLPQMVYEVDDKGVFTFVNHAGLETLGYSFEDLRQGMKVLDVFLPEDRQRAAANLAKLLRGEKIGSNEYTIMRRNGTTFPVAAHSSPIVRGDKVLGVRGICLDISERKQVEESLRRALEQLRNHDTATSVELMKTTGLLSKEIVERVRIEDERNRTERKFRTLVEAAQEVIWTVDLDLRYTYVSPAITRVLGYSVEDLVSMDPLETLPIEHREHMAAALRQECAALSSHHQETVPVCSEEIQQYHKDGTLRWIEVNLAPLREQDGRAAGILGISRDITLRKHAEEALQQAMAQAAQLREVAESANRAKGEFLASMSHELRTPLNSIIGFSEVLEDRMYGDLNPRQLRYVHHVVTSGRHLLALINDILDLAKIDSGKMELQQSTVCLNELLEQSIVMIKEKAAKHRLRVVLHLDKVLSGLSIRADDLKLKQIMFNLLSNAAKFTPDGGVITVDASRDRNLLRIRVTDTGVGISPQDCERVFGTFEQVDSSYSRKQQGTGLGLALSRRMVELHGGNIWVESAGVGQGSSFVFTIPLVTTEEAPA
jgi:PAS domain S-box-containing protein